MPTDIVFDPDGADAIALQAARVEFTGRLQLHDAEHAGPPSDGHIGDFAMTVEHGHNPALGLHWSTTHLWLCVPAEGEVSPASAGKAFWREVQLGPAVLGP